MVMLFLLLSSTDCHKKNFQGQKKKPLGFLWVTEGKEKVSKKQ